MSQEKPETYTAEFKASSVKLANESDQPIAQTAKDLGINVNTLHTWIGKYSRPPHRLKKAARTEEHLYDELKRLKKVLTHQTLRLLSLIFCLNFRSEHSLNYCLFFGIHYNPLHFHILHYELLQDNLHKNSTIFP